MTPAIKAITRAVAALGASVALASCAQEGAPEAETAALPASAVVPAGHACFRPQDVDSWSAPNNRVVYVRVNANRYFEMRLMGDCPDVDWSTRLGIRSTGSDWICSGIDATIIAPSAIGPQHCPVTSLRELSPQEVAALPPRFRP